MLTTLRPPYPTRLCPVRLWPDAPLVYAKEEYTHPGGSAKDRPAISMVNAAARSGRLTPGGRILDAGSGSTAVAEAMTAAALGYKFTAVLPESASGERQRLIRIHHGEVVLTPAADGVPGAMAKAEELERAGYGVYLRQFDNPANPDAHRTGTAAEIDAQLGGAKADAVVCGCGTGGTLYGVWLGLRDRGHTPIPVAAKPVAGGRFCERVPGVADGLGFATPAALPGLRVEEVAEDEVFAALKRLHRLGLPVGPSSGLNVAAATRVARQLGPHSTIVTVLVDRVDRYLSTGLLT